MSCVVRCVFSLERAILLMLEWQDHIIRTFLSGDIFRSMIFHKWTRKISWQALSQDGEIVQKQTLHTLHISCGVRCLCVWRFADWKMSCVVRCVLSLEWAILLKLEWQDHIIRTFLSGDIFACITVVRGGNSTKTKSSYSPHPNVIILTTVIRTFLSVDIYMMKVAYMFAFL